MKTFYALLVMLTAFAVANAEQIKTVQKTDTTMLSEKIDGNYLVRRYLVRHNGDDAQYSIKYSIEASKLPTLAAGNVEEMSSLDKFFQDIKADTAMHVQRIVITGYASPDGNPKSNETLAMSRAQKVYTMLESRYALSSKYNVEVQAEGEEWNDCDDAVKSSDIADKNRVLTILDSSASEATKELQLKQIPSVWTAFRTKILPPMRRVEINVYYNMDTVIEISTLIEKPQAEVAQQPQQATQYYEIVIIEDDNSGIIIDMGEHDGE